MGLVEKDCRRVLLFYLMRSSVPHPASLGVVNNSTPAARKGADAGRHMISSEYCTHVISSRYYLKAI